MSTTTDSQKYSPTDSANLTYKWLMEITHFSEIKPHIRQKYIFITPIYLTDELFVTHVIIIRQSFVIDGRITVSVGMHRIVQKLRNKPGKHFPVN